MPGSSTRSELSRTAFPDPGDNERILAARAHLGSYSGVVLPIVGPLALGPLIAASTRSTFVREHAREAFDFHVSVFLWILLGSILIPCLIGLPIAAAAIVAQLFLPARAALAAANGERYRYPATFHLFGAPSAD